ncbi:hypothetical protein BC938DRAFT_475797 [Jimgerdemannia flammicorona]|uniref:Uncharacterized protein n=1 Tax=Jimgerdemannia flammicorona TaxID=994334 RepID=A0A433QRB0_9FUNG|nr:hypothetical protein BC938DRAFT_475797 [Jimgerdemannia flammicorona]
MTSADDRRAEPHKATMGYPITTITNNFSSRSESTPRAAGLRRQAYVEYIPHMQGHKQISFWTHRNSELPHIYTKLSTHLPPIFSPLHFVSSHTTTHRSKPTTLTGAKTKTSQFVGILLHDYET